MRIEARGVDTMAAAILLLVGGGSYLANNAAIAHLFIKELTVMGTGPRATTISLTSTFPPPNGSSIYRPTAAGILPYNRFAPPYNAGEASETEALRIVRKMLDGYLALHAERTLAIVSGLEENPIPRRGTTVELTLPSGVFTGVVQDHHYNCPDGVTENLTLKLVDYSSRDMQ